MQLRALVMAIALALSIVSTAQVSRAQTAAAAGEEDKRKGDDAMVALRYGDALAYYQRAYEANKSPALLYNMGRAYEALGDFPKALESLEAFKEQAPPDLKARVPKLAELIADVERHVATLIITTNQEGAEIRLGERVMGKTRAGQNILHVSSGAARLAITKEGFFPIEKDLTLAGGKTELIEAPMSSRGDSAVLRITSPVTGATVSVDGAPVGTVPAEWIVRAGSHRVGLTRDGWEPSETSVIVVAGQAKDVDVKMNEKSSLTKQWWFWTVIGVVVVAGGIAIYIAATTEKDPDRGTIQPGQVKAQSRPLSPLSFSF